MRPLENRQEFKRLHPPCDHLDCVPDCDHRTAHCGRMAEVAERHNKTVKVGEALMDELPCMKIDREAAQRVAAILALPMPESSDMLGIEGKFDPWEILPSLYGSYSSEFDKLAIEVLCDVRDGTHKRDGLDVEMFREMLCTSHLCDYGTSPRVCFPTSEFRELLPLLIEKWRAYAELAWGEPVTLSL